MIRDGMAMREWITKGFEAFQAGTFGSGGQNLFVSRSGALLMFARTSRIFLARSVHAVTLTYRVLGLLCSPP